MTLTKVKLNFFVVITTAFGAILQTGFSQIPWLTMVHTILGTGAAALGAAAFNQLLEIEHDRNMERTADRPLPARRMSVYFAFTVAWILCGFGIIHLSSTTNLVAAALTAATIALYIFVYTPLKRKSALNTLIGAIPGAIPPVVGWVALGGELISFEALFLFAILFFWQMPHFMALAWMYRKDYDRAGYRMWTAGDEQGTRTAWIMISCSLLMYACSFLPYVLGLSGTTYLVGAAALSVWFSFPVARFYRSRSVQDARKVLKATVVYIPLLLSALIAPFR